MFTLALACGCTALVPGCSLDRASVQGRIPRDGAPNDGSRDGSIVNDAGVAADGAASTDAGGLDTGPPDACAGRPESCNGRDDDCDGEVDEGTDCGCDRVRGADGRSYLFCTETRDYDGARQHCQELGYDLVVIDDAAENAFVREQQGSRGNDFLLGLDDRAVEGTFVWLDGRTAWRDGSALTYTNWGGGQPDDFFGDEDCVEMHSGGDSNDVDCDASRRHVCESPEP